MYKFLYQVNLNTAYYDKGIVINDRKKVFKHYIKTQCLIDATCIAAIVSDILFENSKDTSSINEYISDQALLLKILFMGNL